MKTPQFIGLLSTGALLLFLVSSASADPTKVAEYSHAESGEHFELFQEHDGSYFCSVERANGTLSRFELRPGGLPKNADLRAADGLDLQSLFRKSLFERKEIRVAGETEKATRAWCRLSEDGEPVCDTAPAEELPELKKPVGLLLLFMTSEHGGAR